MKMHQIKSDKENYKNSFKHLENDFKVLEITQKVSLEKIQSFEKVNKTTK